MNKRQKKKLFKKNYTVLRVIRRNKRFKRKMHMQIATKNTNGNGRIYSIEAIQRAISRYNDNTVDQMVLYAELREENKEICAHISLKEACEQFKKFAKLTDIPIISARQGFYTSCPTDFQALDFRPPSNDTENPLVGTFIGNPILINSGQRIHISDPAVLELFKLDADKAFDMSCKSWNDAPVELALKVINLRTPTGTNVPEVEHPINEDNH